MPIESPGRLTNSWVCSSIRWRSAKIKEQECLKVDQIDLIQMHNLVEEAEWQTALEPHGALETLIEARAGAGAIIGVTGHGTQVAARHRRSLEWFAFDSVLFPYNFTMLRNRSVRGRRRSTYQAV